LYEEEKKAEYLDILNKHKAGLPVRNIPGMFTDTGYNYWDMEIGSNIEHLNRVTKDITDFVNNKKLNDNLVYISTELSGDIDDDMVDSIFTIIHWVELKDFFEIDFTYGNNIIKDELISLYPRSYFFVPIDLENKFKRGEISWEELVAQWGPTES